MKILSVNRGSSSIKCDLYDFAKFPKQLALAVWQAELQWKNNFEKPAAVVNKSKKTIKARSAEEALKQILPDEAPDVIGHRIVHGGGYFAGPVLVNASVKKKIHKVSGLAPLHNPAELEGIELLEKLFPRIPQVAVFDTAFHHSLPKKAALYPGPYKWYTQGIQRFGFHGISFDYCSTRAAEMVGRNIKKLKMVICHLGSGASLCAVREGKSIDTTMGFTPLEGLMMDTRSGSIDPGIFLHLLKKQRVETVTEELYHSSGLLGISGESSDMRDILKKSGAGNVRATLALDMYLHRLNSLIGSMAASLQGIDILIFTAGIGENAELVRAKVCENFSFLGVQLDKRKNALKGEADRDLSAAGSKVKVLLVHTQEAFQIAKECWKIRHASH